jgi:hypothetical protein
MQGQPPFLISTANPAQGTGGTLSAAFPLYYPEVIIVVMVGAISRIIVMPETG